MCGWTMLCKWGHHVATFPVMNGTLRHTCRMTEIPQIIIRSPRARILYAGFRYQPPRAPTAPCSKKLPGSDPNHQIIALGVILDLKDVEHVGRCTPCRRQ
eukprot:1747815-Pleurochrysis_carterae.AAC.6